MTKIKNFKINLRAREIARWLKKERGLETTPELELAIDQLCKQARSWIEPAAVYTTLTRPIAEKTTAIAFPETAIAVSILAVSIGPALGLERQSACADALRAPLLQALEIEALAQTLQFAVRLVQDQAKEEDCDMTPPVPAEDAVASPLAALVGIQRIGIVLDASAALQIPAHARVAWVFWTPAGKGTARRAAEKAVA